MGGSDRNVDFAGHGHRFFLAGVDHGQPEVFSCHEGRRDAGNLCGQDLDGGGISEEAGEFFAALIHEHWVDLVVDEAIDFENAVSEVFTLSENFLF